MEDINEKYRSLFIVWEGKGKVVPVLKLSTTPWRRIGGGGIAPRILVLGTKRRWVVSLTTRPLFSRERASGTHHIGSLVSPRAGLDSVVKRKIPTPCRELNPQTRIVQPVASRYTDWAIPALVILERQTKRHDGHLQKVLTLVYCYLVTHNEFSSFFQVP
jgi:hypothetical protein